MNIIPPRSGVAFTLKKGDKLQVYDVQGEQVSDFICYNLQDRTEYLSSGRTLDYAETLFLTKGHVFYSNRSNEMFQIIEDTVGRHDFLLAPCSAEMFRITYGHTDPHHGCFGNLKGALAEYGISGDTIPTCFNIFMHVDVNGETGKLSVLPPKSKAGDSITLEAKMDLIVGMTACSAGMSNNFSYKPIGYEIL
ncbi:urea carboxylase-associated family protein [Chryseolinea sp. H1M3-3]|uniref:urea carboxylase-associated family protein n=1 Tax=Chryseolinea sp. H1M3-3 TaxID=3034144 RepID=UPI0023EB98D4|nr:urea carboxylase-associated family protein [Chryseolinea sp. H1M3-3]